MEGNWSVRRTSQKPHIDFRVRVWLGYTLDLRAYATVSLGPGPGPGQGPGLWTSLFSAARTQFYSSNFSPLPSWNSSEAVICIYIRSVDQARALLAQGVCVRVCVCSSVVPFDSWNTSAGRPRTVHVICPARLSSMKKCQAVLFLSCSLSYHYFPTWRFFFFLFGFCWHNNVNPYSFYCNTVIQ